MIPVPVPVSVSVSVPIPVVSVTVPVPVSIIPAIVPVIAPVKIVSTIISVISAYSFLNDIAFAVFIGVLFDYTAIAVIKRIIIGTIIFPMSVIFRVKSRGIDIKRRNRT